MPQCTWRQYTASSITSKPNLQLKVSPMGKVLVRSAVSDANSNGHYLWHLTWLLGPPKRPSGSTRQLRLVAEGFAHASPGVASFHGCDFVKLGPDVATCANVSEMLAFLAHNSAHSLFRSFFSGVVHRYTLRVTSSSADVTLITLSGLPPGMSKACETMRDPGFNLSSCGISFAFRTGPRYKVTT